MSNEQFPKNPWFVCPIVSDTYYAFTFNPKHQASDHVKMPNLKLVRKNNEVVAARKYDYLQWQHDKLRSIFKFTIDVLYDLYPEVSKGGRIHYHGWILIKDLVNFQMFDLPWLKLNGTFAITFCDIDWISYVMKDYHLMNRYCKMHNIPYHIVHPSFASSKGWNPVHDYWVDEERDLKTLVEAKSVREPLSTDEVRTERSRKPERD